MRPTNNTKEGMQGYRKAGLTYPPFAETIKNFNRRVHATLCKRQRNGVCVRVAPAT